MIRIIILCLLPMQVYAWGTPASATATVEARITAWNDNPCNYGDRFPEACDYARTHNLFPMDTLQHSTTILPYVEPGQPTETTTTVDYGPFITTTTTTNYE